MNWFQIIIICNKFLNKFNLNKVWNYDFQVFDSRGEFKNQSLTEELILNKIVKMWYLLSSKEILKTFLDQFPNSLI
jgi:hypothetical protein